MNGPRLRWLPGKRARPVHRTPAYKYDIGRSIAIDILPGTWQIILGTALLLSILFLPEGLGSLYARLRRRVGMQTP